LNLIDSLSDSVISAANGSINSSRTKRASGRYEQKQSHHLHHLDSYNAVPRLVFRGLQRAQPMLFELFIGFESAGAAVLSIPLAGV
jgi:hypothetical protein